MLRPLGGNTAGKVREFLEDYRRNWAGREVEALLESFSRPFVVVRSGSPTILDTEEVLRGNLSNNLNSWKRQDAGDDVATQLTDPGNDRSAVVLMKWGQWIFRFPDGGIVQAPDVTYVLANQDGRWKQVLAIADWRADKVGGG